MLRGDLRGREVAIKGVRRPGRAGAGPGVERQGLGGCPRALERPRSVLHPRPGLSLVPRVFTKCAARFLEPASAAAALAGAWGGPPMEDEGRRGTTRKGTAGPEGRITLRHGTYDAHVCAVRPLTLRVRSVCLRLAPGTDANFVPRAWPSTCGDTLLLEERLSFPRLRYL